MVIAGISTAPVNLHAAEDCENCPPDVYTYSAGPAITPGTVTKDGVSTSGAILYAPSGDFPDFLHYQFSQNYHAAGGSDTDNYIATIYSDPDACCEPRGESGTVVDTTLYPTLTISPSVPSMMSTPNRYTLTHRWDDWPVAGVYGDDAAKPDNGVVNTLVVWKVYQVSEVEITNDFQVLKDQNTNWTDTGNLYTAPEYRRSPYKKAPIVLTYGVAPQAKVRIKVVPSGLNCRLTGKVNGTIVAQASFGSTGGDQDVQVTINRSRSSVGVDEFAVDWEVTMLDIDQFPYVSAGTTDHKVYAVFGEPKSGYRSASGESANITEKRLAKVVEFATGQTSAALAAEAIYDGLTNALEPAFDVNSEWMKEDPWYGMAEGGSGQCVDLAALMALQLRAIGAFGRVGFIYATTDLVLFDYAEDMHEDMPWQGCRDAKLIFIAFGVPNSWEAVCVAYGKYYAPDFMKSTSALEILEGCVLPNLANTNRQVWAEEDCGIMTDPPYPVPLP